ncbi:MAG: hypothetical protein R3C68_11600 [Myxococcota bacterium]
MTTTTKAYTQVPGYTPKEYVAVQDVWQKLVVVDGHAGRTDAYELVKAAGNTDAGRKALKEILKDPQRSALIGDSQAASYLRINAQFPLPPNARNHRNDRFFDDRSYTGMHTSKTHKIENPNEMLYFDVALGWVGGTLDNVDKVREHMKGSGFDPILVNMPDGSQKAIGSVFINEVKDSTFGPYNEFIFVIAAVPSDAPASAKSVDYVNGFSLQVPYDRGAAMYLSKLWLDELGPIEGGNTRLGCNKDFGGFVFENQEDGRRKFRAADKDGEWIVDGYLPRTISPEEAAKAGKAYAEAAASAGTKLPTGTAGTVPIASRPDGEKGAATNWSFTVDWRRPVIQEISPEQAEIHFGDSQWGKFYESLGFTPKMSMFADSAVAQINEPKP